MILFPFAEYWMFYVGFTLFVLFMLALDLGVFHKKAHEVSVKEASIWMMAIALFLAKSIGADTKELSELWVEMANNHI